MNKRCFDLFIAIPSLFIISPFLLAIALLIKHKMGPPILFRQVRPGLGAAPFTLYKFTTMTNNKDLNGKLLPDKYRLTKLGKLLRATSIDELPELYNVIKGEMSIVGPRPLLMKYIDRYTPEQARRHNVKPGLTGWAQVNGRNTISWKDKFELDIWYVDNWSIWLDIKIIALTLKKVISSEGINHAGVATMSEFMGNN